MCSISFYNLPKKQVKLIIGISAFVLIFAGVYFLYNKLGGNYSPDKLIENNNNSESQSDRTSSQNENEKAPDFTVIDKDNNTVKLYDFIGKPIVLNLWASWCPPCKSELPDFNNAFKTNENVLFMMVNMTDGTRETIKKANEYVKSQGFVFPVYFDTDSSAAIAYNASSIPATYFIDKDGNIAAYAKGMIDASTLQKGIDMITK